MHESILSAFSTYGHENIELEWRLGRVLDGAFRPGVPKDVWEMVKARCDKLPCGTATPYATVEHVADGGVKRVVPAMGHEYWMSKNRLLNIDDPRWRVSISREGMLDQPPDPMPHFSFVRHKVRYSYNWSFWKIDLTRVTSNHSDSMDNEEEVFEIEVELADPSVAFVYTMKYIVETAESLIDQLTSLSK